MTLGQEMRWPLWGIVKGAICLYSILNSLNLDLEQPLEHTDCQWTPENFFETFVNTRYNFFKWIPPKTKHVLTAVHPLAVDGCRWYSKESYTTPHTSILKQQFHGPLLAQWRPFCRLMTICVWQYHAKRESKKSFAKGQEITAVKSGS